MSKLICFASNVVNIKYNRLIFLPEVKGKK